MTCTRWSRNLKSARPHLETLENRCLFSAGQLDPTFGAGGKVASDFLGPANDTAAALAVQSDGKLVVAGVSADASAINPSRLALARYNTDGTLDAGFGQKGQALTDLGGNFSVAAVLVQPTGQVVVAGTSGSEFLLVRYTAGGLLDAGFGSGGKVLTDLGAGSAAQAAAVQADGKIVVAGQTFRAATGNDFAVVRYNADGTLDAGFGAGGEVTTDFGGNDGAFSVAIQPDQKIVVGGGMGLTSDSDEFDRHQILGTAALARYNPDGSLDATFGSGGKKSVPFIPLVDNLVVQTDGKILLGGTTRGPLFFGPYFSYLTRVDTAGNLDAGFGSGGQVRNDLFGFGLVGRQIAVTSDGKIEAIGTTSFASNSLVLTRYQSNGTLDLTFGRGFFSGSVLVSAPGFDPGAGGAVTAGNKVLVVGSAPGPSSQDFAVLRFNADGSADSTFGSGGRVTTDFLGSANDSAAAVVRQADGKLVVAGAIGGIGGVARYNADGSLDTSFGNAGQAPSTGFNVTDVALQSDGKIVVVGVATVTVPYATAVARYNPDGTLDTSFGDAGQLTLPADPATGGSEARAVAIEADGKIVIVSAPAYSGNGTLVRLNGDGSLDTTFHADGSNLGSGVEDVAIRPDGRIDVLTDGGVFQYRSDGSADLAFGQGGVAPIAFGGSGDHASSFTLQGDGKLVIAGARVDGTFWFSPTALGLARLSADGTPDASFGCGTGVVVTDLGDSEAANKVAVEPDGRIVVLGTGGSVVRYLAAGDLDATFGNGGVATASFAGVQDDSFADLVLQADDKIVLVGQTFRAATESDVGLARLLAHDPTVEAASVTLAADLQTAVTALATTPASLTPRVVIHVQDPARMPAVAAAIAGLTVKPGGSVIEILLNVEPGSYSLGQITVPAGLRLLLDGTGGPCSPRAFVGTSAPALTVLSGDVVIRNGAMFRETGDAATIVVKGGRLAVRGSTIEETTGGSQAAIAITAGLVDLGTSSDPNDPNYGGNTINVNGAGTLIRLTGPNDVYAFGDTFLQDGQPFTDNFRIEDVIDHSLDGLDGGTVFWVPNNVFVSVNHGKVQRGVDMVPVGGTVNVETGVHGDFAAGSKLLTIAFEDGSSMTQQLDDLDPTRRSLVVMGTYGNDTIKFEPGPDKGARVTMNHVPTGTFLPTGRLIANGVDGSDDIEVSDGITLSAWLYGGYSGNNRLVAGGGNDVLIGGFGNDTLIGGGGRDLLIGEGGNDLLKGNGDDDILVGGATLYDFDEVSLTAIMAEWTSADDYATRVNDLVNGGGLNGSVTLTPDVTVYDAGGSSVLDGGSGRDLFFASATDTITGRRKDETAFAM
jgi:uncharacterized delta-60 repeat protein